MKQTRRLAGAEGKTPGQIWEEYRKDLDRMLDHALGSTPGQNLLGRAGQRIESEKPPPG